MPRKPTYRITNRAHLRTWSAADIKDLRSYAGWTQLRLADEVGVTQPTVADWERGAYRASGASLAMLTVLANSLGFFQTAVDHGDSETRYRIPNLPLVRISDR